MTGRSLGQLIGPTLLAVVIWFGAAWVPRALSSHDERRDDAESERLLLTTELSDARELPDMVGGFNRIATTADTLVPPTAELAGFVRATGRAGKAAGVFIEQMAPLTVSSDTDEEALTSLPPGTSSLTISVGARGSYDQVMGFADELRSMERLVVIDLLDLTADEENTGQIILDLELRIFTTDRLVTTPDFDDDDLFGEIAENVGETVVGQSLGDGDGP